MVFRESRFPVISREMIVINHLTGRHVSHKNLTSQWLAIEIAPGFKTSVVKELT